MKQFIIRCKRLEGDPHHISMGIGIGIFISFTPTIPFQTVIAVALAVLLNANKIAAAIGVWLSNPLTLPFFYLGTYKVGAILLNRPNSFSVQYQSIKGLLSLGWDVTFTMMAGGIILGIPLSIAAYLITKKIFIAIELKRKSKRKLLL